MALPITVPFTFANATVTQNLSSLDADFSTVYNAVNGIGNGTVALANVNISGGNVSISAISATGTANSSTYLRGDGSWATVSGGGGGNGTVTSVDANSSVSGFSFINGPVTTSGTLTLTGPAPGTSGNVLTSNGTSWISKANSAALQGAKAWCNFNGTLSGPITPRANYNISSITKNGTGDYTLNFTVALADANYAPTFGICHYGAGNYSGLMTTIAGSQSSGATTKTTSALRIVSGGGSALYDNAEQNVVILGN